MCSSIERFELFSEIWPFHLKKSIDSLELLFIASEENESAYYETKT